MFVVGQVHGAVAYDSIEYERIGCNNRAVV